MFIAMNRFLIKSGKEEYLKKFGNQEKHTWINFQVF